MNGAACFPLQDKANPLAQILSAAMLLRYALNEATAADRIEAAVLAALDAGYRTGDIMSAGMVSPFSPDFLFSFFVYFFSFFLLSPLMCWARRARYLDLQGGVGSGVN